MIRPHRVRSRSSAFFSLLALSLLGAFAASSRAAESPSTDWPLSPLKRPALPEVRSKAWVQNPIDAFVLAGLEKAGLQPNPPADKLTLLRRVSYDLTGLLPTAAQREAFLADHSPDAYE